MSTYQAAVFDFGGVLTTSIGEAFLAFEQRLGVTSGGILEYFLHHYDHHDDNNTLHRLERGEIGEEELYRSLAEHLGSDVRVPSDAEGWRAEMFRDVRMNTLMIEAVGRLRKRYRTGLLTNNVREWGRHWRNLVDLDEAFDVVVDSSSVGMRKPDLAIFMLTCERLGVRPEECVFVDDIPSNVEGAEAAGMTGVVFTSTAEVMERLAAYFPGVGLDDLCERAAVEQPAN
jgi:putative hydrolase of the HAD superfamily